MLLYLLWELEVCASNCCCWPSRLGGQVEVWGVCQYLALHSPVPLKIAYVWLCWASPAARGLSPVGGGVGASHWVASPVGSTGSVAATQA